MTEILMAPGSPIPASAESIICKIVEKTPMWDAAFLIFQIIAVSMLIIAFYIMVRASAVGIFRRKLIREWDIEAEKLIQERRPWRFAVDWYDSLPDFYHMMHAFWVWPLSKFVPESCADYVARKLHIQEMIAEQEKAAAESQVETKPNE